MNSTVKKLLLALSLAFGFGNLNAQELKHLDFSRDAKACFQGATDKNGKEFNSISFLYYHML
jgi:hypothetical protein